MQQLSVEQPTMLKTVVNVILTCNNWWRWKSPCTTHTEQNGIHSLAKKIMINNRF
jgi:hypothetical protein